MTCLTCQDGTRAATPLIVLGSIIGLVGGAVAYNYKYHYDFYSTYFDENKERLFMLMNQGTMVVSHQRHERHRTRLFKIHMNNF